MRKLNKETAKILNDSITSAIDKADSLKEGFLNIRDSLDDIGRQFLKLALQKLVFDQRAGWLNNVFGVGAADGKAGGGPVEAGRLYRVGERGEEWFRPRVAGTIVPNHQLRTMGVAGGQVFHFNIESTDGPGVEAAIERVRPALLNDAVEASRNVIGRDLGRNSKLRGLARG